MALESGQEIAGRYQVTRKLGQGGFGETWEGVDLETELAVAVKALDLSRVSDWKSVELFEREAHVLESLNHPRIPDYLDFIPVESDRTGFLVQELAPGADLERIIATGRRLNAAEAQALALKMLDVLEYLYSRKPPVIHRDIKPANILLDNDDDIHLVDFGSVQDIRRRSETAGSTVAGTFGYMAPEQLRGVATPASDLYGLGMTLIFTLCGKDPSQLPEKRLKVDFRDAVKVDEHFTDFLERLIEPVAEDRFSSPTEAKAFLETQLVPSYSKTEVSRGESDIAKLLEARTAKEQSALVKAQSQAVANTGKLQRRVSVTENTEGWIVQFNPPPYKSRLFDTGPVVAGAVGLVGPLIMMPPLSLLWPSFLVWWPVRWLVWTVLVLLAAAIFAWRQGRYKQLVLTQDGHYALKVKGKSKPVDFGRLEKLDICSGVTDGIGHIIFGRGMSFRKLHPSDVELVKQTKALAKRIQFLRVLNEHDVQYLVVGKSALKLRAQEEIEKLGILLIQTRQGRVGTGRDRFPHATKTPPDQMQLDRFRYPHEVPARGSGWLKR